MKKSIAVSIVIVLIGLSLPVHAQKISWEIRLHSTDITMLEKEITAYTSQGYIPLGITYDNAELYIMYVQVPEFGLKAWYLEGYKTETELQNGITNTMNRGYMPTGITYTGEQFYVLYVLVDNSAQAWQLVRTKSGSDALQKALQPYVSKKYLPVGITTYGEAYWTLLLQIPNTTATSWKIESYATGTHGDGVNRHLEAGNIPWGIDYRGTDIDILYVGF